MLEPGTAGFIQSALEKDSDFPTMHMHMVDASGEAVPS